MKKIFMCVAYSTLVSMAMTSCDDEDEIICMDKVWYKDSDGDGRGDRTIYLYSCKVQPQGFVSNPDDKNDKDPNDGG